MFLSLWRLNEDSDSLKAAFIVRTPKSGGGWQGMSQRGRQIAKWAERGRRAFTGVHPLGIWPASPASLVLEHMLTLLPLADYGIDQQHLLHLLGHRERLVALSHCVATHASVS